MADQHQDAMVALVRWLSRRSPKGATIEMAGKNIVLVDPSGRCRLAVTREVLLAAVQAGLVCRKRSAVALLPVARAFLRRVDDDGPMPHADQHRTIGRIEIHPESEPIRINLDESPLASFARMKDRSGAPWFPADALKAGQRLFADFTFGRLQPRTTMRWQPRIDQPRGAGGDFSQAVMDARRRFSRAAQAIGPDLADIVIDVCCFEKGLERVEQERGWPARSAKLMLRTGLMALDRHYNPPAPDRLRRLERWRDDLDDPVQPGR